MPLHDDEMDKRREKREALRKKREAEAKRMKRMLILAAVVLVLCGAGIFALVWKSGGLDAGGESSKPVQSVRETEPPKETVKATSPLQQSTTQVIHINAAGDLNVTDTVVKSGLAVSGYDYSAAFKDVAAVLADADLTVMNFEGNVCGEPYGTETTSAPADLLRDLRNAGVDLLQVANSCSINNGLNGLNATLQAIRAAGIEPLGAYSSANEYRTSKGYTITEVQGVKVAFVAFTKGLGGRGMPAGNEDLVNLLYTDYASTYQKIDTERIETILKNVEAERPDITVAMLHWGSEYNDDISKTQGSIVSLMQKRGVDIIIGTHPHTVQPIVYDQAAGTLVAYSLGDFFGDAERGGTNYSIILNIEITKDSAAGTTKVTGYSYTPIYTVKSGESAGDYAYSRVVRIEKALEAYNCNFLDKVTSTCKASMEKALTRIEERLVMPKDED
ncbi:MAG: CapA family protein [Eubacteriales bacterium]|nr:CapA family protein [Eubacteriales bacterium]